MPTAAVAAVAGLEVDTVLRRTGRTYRDLSAATGIDDPTKLGRILGRYPGLIRAESTTVSRLLTAAVGPQRATELLDEIRTHPGAATDTGRPLRTSSALKTGISGSTAIDVFTPLSQRAAHLCFTDGSEHKLLCLPTTAHLSHVAVVPATYGSWAVIHGRLVTAADRLALDRLVLIDVVHDGRGPIGGAGRASGIGAAWAVGIDFAEQHNGGPQTAPLLQTSSTAPPAPRCGSRTGRGRTPSPARRTATSALPAGH